MANYMNEEQFKAVWNQATERAKQKGSDKESSVLAEAITECLKKGVSEQGYVRKHLEFDSDLPSKKPGKSLRELFDSTWASVLNQARSKMADQVAQRVWGFSFKGLRDVGFLSGYFSAVERQADTCAFVPDKKLKIWLNGKIAEDIKKHGVSKISVKKNVFHVPMSLMLEILQKRLGVPADKHEPFAKMLGEGLDKKFGRRTERMTNEVATCVADIDWLA